MQGLLRELVAQCADAPQQRAAALAALGEALSQRSMHEDAGVAFAAAGQLEAALASYRSASAWQMAMALAGGHVWLCFLHVAEGLRKISSEVRVPSCKLSVQHEATGGAGCCMWHLQT